MTQFTFCSSSVCMHFVPTRRVEMCTDELRCFCFTSWYVHILPTHSTFGELMNEEGLKGKELYITLAIPLLSFQQGRWLIQGLTTVGKEMIRLLSHFCFFKCQGLLPLCRVSSGLNGKHGFSGFWASHSISHRSNILALFSIWVSQCSPWGVGPPEFCAHGILRRL